MAKISIILPTYNVERYIARALESCINQTFKDIEIIVVDDCGNDKSIEIAKEFANKDNRIKIICNRENLGLFRARYEGVKAAGGGYIMFLDPDDYLDLNICQKCIDYIGDSLILRFAIAQKTNNSMCYFLPKFKNFEDFSSLMKRYIHMNWNIWGNLIQKDWYMERISHCENLRILMAEDLLAFAHLINPKMKSIDYVGYYYEIRSDSITEKKDFNKDIKDYRLVADLLKKSKLDKNIVDYYLYFLNYEINKCLYSLKQISYLRFKFRKKMFRFKVQIRRLRYFWNR